MTIRNVPSDFSTISLAISASNPGDTILVDASYSGNESATITVNNLIISAPAEVGGISLSLATGIIKLTLAGTSDIDVTGNAGNNVLIGNAGNNVLDGGSGQDHYYGSAGNDVFVGGGGADGDIVDYSREALAGATHGVIVNQSGKIVQNGVAQDTVIDGFGDTDSIARIPNVTGSKFADKIYGGAHDNVLSGLGGADFIQGWLGADQLRGGGGADRFSYTSINDSTVAGTGRDDILDFSSLQKDKINVHAIDADTNTAGNQDFAFVGASNFTGHAGDLRYFTVANGVMVQGDVDGDKTADFAIHVSNVTSLADTDFIL